MPEIKNETVRWISLSVGLFDDDKIALVESMPDGEILVNCWLRLLCMAGKQNAGGYVYATQNIAYTDEMLAAMWKKKLPTVKLALKAFRDLEMIDVEKDGKIFLNNFHKWQEPLEKIQANREATRIKVANWRANKKLLMPSNEESNKEDIHTDTIHNNTIQCNSNSNGYVTVTQKDKKKTVRQPYSDDFLRVWAILPKGSKYKASQSWAALDAGIKDNIIEQLKKSVALCASVNRTHRDLVTWINQNGWEDNFEASVSGWGKKPQQAQVAVVSKPKRFAPNRLELEQEGATYEDLQEYSKNYDAYKSYWYNAQPTLKEFINKIRSGITYK